MFIGREAELQFLNDKYEENKGQLIVLYGRRRVGKTETLREFCKGKPHIFYSCTQTTDRVQLAKFSKQLLKRIFLPGNMLRSSLIGKRHLELFWICWICLTELKKSLLS